MQNQYIFSAPVGDHVVYARLARPNNWARPPFLSEPPSHVESERRTEPTSTQLQRPAYPFLEPDWASPPPLHHHELLPWTDAIDPLPRWYVFPDDRKLLVYILRPPARVYHGTALQEASSIVSRPNFFGTSDISDIYARRARGAVFEFALTRPLLLLAMDRCENVIALQDIIPDMDQIYQGCEREEQMMIPHRLSVRSFEARVFEHLQSQRHDDSIGTTLQGTVALYAPFAPQPHRLFHSEMYLFQPSSCLQLVRIHPVPDANPLPPENLDFVMERKPLPQPLTVLSWNLGWEFQAGPRASHKTAAGMFAQQNCLLPNNNILSECGRRSAQWIGTQLRDTSHLIVCLQEVWQPGFREWIKHATDEAQCVLRVLVASHTEKGVTYQSTILVREDVWEAPLFEQSLLWSDNTGSEHRVHQLVRLKFRSHHHAAVVDVYNVNGAHQHEDSPHHTFQICSQLYTQVLIGRGHHADTVIMAGDWNAEGVLLHMLPLTTADQHTTTWLQPASRPNTEATCCLIPEWKVRFDDVWVGPAQSVVADDLVVHHHDQQPSSDHRPVSCMVRERQTYGDANVAAPGRASAVVPK